MAVWIIAVYITDMWLLLPVELRITYSGQVHELKIVHHRVPRVIKCADGSPTWNLNGPICQR